MDPITLAILGLVGGAILGGMQGAAQVDEKKSKLDAENAQLQEQKRLLAENQKALLNNLSTYLGGLQQRDLQIQAATQLAIREREIQNAKDVGQTILSVGEAGIGNSSTATRLKALNEIDTAKDIGIRQTNLQNALLQSYLTKQQSIAQTKTNYNSLSAQATTLSKKIASNNKEEDNLFWLPLLNSIGGALKGVSIFL